MDKQRGAKPRPQLKCLLLESGYKVIKGNRTITVTSSSVRVPHPSHTHLTPLQHPSHTPLTPLSRPSHTPLTPHLGLRLKGRQYRKWEKHHKKLLYNNEIELRRADMNDSELVNSINEG